MGKMKQFEEEDMKKYPDTYNGLVDYEFWIQSRKKKLLERKYKKRKGKKNGQKR